MAGVLPEESGCGKGKVGAQPPQWADSPIWRYACALCTGRPSALLEPLDPRQRVAARAAGLHTYLSLAHAEGSCRELRCLATVRRPPRLHTPPPHRRRSTPGGTQGAPLGSRISSRIPHGAIRRPRFLRAEACRTAFGIRSV